MVVLVVSEGSVGTGSIGVGSTGVELLGSTILILILVFIVAILYYSPPIVIYMIHRYLTNTNTHLVLMFVFIDH